MIDVLPVPALPFPVTPSQLGVWRYDEQADAVLADESVHPTRVGRDRDHLS